jgi:putative transposase
MDGLPQRTRPAHFVPIESHNRPVVVFVTVCTFQRRRLLVSEAVHDHLRTAWQSAGAWRVGRYVLMPDHLHLFCSPGQATGPPLEDWIAFWKSRTAATWPGEKIGRIWQRDHWDTQLRAGENYRAKWEYMRNNPVRAGLVADPDAWPFHGEINVLWWLN